MATKKKTKRKASPRRKPPPPVAAHTCATCGAGFDHPIGKPGRPPKHCPDHRKKRGTPRAPEANAARGNARKRAKRRAATAAEGAAELDQALQLAAAMAIYSKASDAARWAGLALEGEALKRVAQLAKTPHPDIIAGDARALGARLMAAMHLIAQSAVVQREAISPRDLPHVLRAFAQARELTAPVAEASYSEVFVTVLDEHGKPIDRG